MNVMKKISILFAALAVFGFSSCSKTELVEAPDGAKDFTISALITKTVNDGESTEWSAGDAINVFHASAGTTTYGTNDEFTIAEEDLGTGTFRGTLTEAQYDSNDWYAFYPYNSKLSTPANTDVFFNIGCKNSSSAAQIQDGNNSTAHLCGEYFPMWAQAKSVAKGSGISLAFNNAVSVVNFHVTNKTSKPVTVSSLSITADQDIIGSYYIDFSGDAPVFTASNASYVAKEAKLNVSNGTALDANASADFYLAIKPFTNEAGKNITFNVNGCEKTITTAESFKPGNIKTVNFSYDKEAEDLSGDYLITGKSNQDTYAMGLYSSGNNIKAISTPLEFVGEGKVFETDEIAQAKVTVTKITEGDYAGMYSIKDSNDKYLYAAGNGANYLKVQESIDKNAVWAINKDKDGYSIVASKSSNRNILMFNASSNPKLFSCYSGGQSSVSLLSYSNVIPDTTPAIQGIKDPDKVSAEGGDVDVQYTIKNPVEGKTITATKEVGADWISLNTSTANLIKVSVSANSTDKERSSEVTVSYPGAESVTFTVTQAAAGASKDPIVLDLTTKAASCNAYNTTTTYGDWVIVNGANNNKGWEYFKMGGKSATISDANPCYIYYTKKVSDKISEITVNLPSGSLSKSGMSVNSWGVYIYSDTKMETQVDYVAGGTITKNEGSFSFKPTEGKTWQNCYVKVSWDLANTTSTNGIVCVDNVTIKF